MSDSDFTNSTTQSDYALPLVVAITGQRDLLASEVPNIRARVNDLLIWLDGQYPDLFGTKCVMFERRARKCPSFI